MCTSVGFVLTRRAHLDPELEALVEVERERRFTYKELNARTNQVANVLLAKGLRKGDRVAFLMRNGVEFVESYFAVAKIGAVAVPLNWRLALDELEFIVKDSGSLALMYDSTCDSAALSLFQRKPGIHTWLRSGPSDPAVAFADSYEEQLRKSSAAEPRLSGADDDLLFIMYTSGTTGRPKGVMHTHETMIWMSFTMNTTCDIRYQDRDLAILPLFHIGALLPLTAVIHRGGTVVVLRSFDAGRIFQTIEAERITTMWGVATTLRLMMQHEDRDKYNCSSLRWVVGGGESVPVSLIEYYAKLGIRVLQDYGLTECGPATIISPQEAMTKAGSVGKPYVHTNVKVVNEEGAEVAPEQVGEVVVKGRHIMKGYWKQPKETDRAIRNGWLYTGDLGRIDENGYLYIQGRRKDIIISGGENISLAEIERVIIEHPKVREVAVIGQPSSKWGESPAAIVVMKDGERISAKELIDYCREKIAGYKVPHAVEFTTEIPRTPTGKPKKHVLRERFPGPAPE